MFKRPDGRVLKDVEPMQAIMPYVMRTRTDSMNMYEEGFDCAPLDAYIKEKAAEGLEMTYMDIIRKHYSKYMYLYFCSFISVK